MDFERLERSLVVVSRERLGILAARFGRKSARKVVWSHSVLIEHVRLVGTFSKVPKGGNRCCHRGSVLSGRLSRKGRRHRRVIVIRRASSTPKLIAVMALRTTTHHFGDIAVYCEWHQVFTSVTQVQDPTAFIRRGETSC
jgi:hypothetical protein